jgi:hypothetical protein
VEAKRQVQVQGVDAVGAAQIGLPGRALGGVGVLPV